MEVTLRIDEWFLNMVEEHKLMVQPPPQDFNPELLTKNLLTERGLTAMILLCNYMAGSIPTGSWQFQGLQAFMAVAFQKLEEQQKMQTQEGETQHGDH